MEPLNGDALKEKMKLIVKDLKGHEIKINNRFKGWENLQNGIAAKHQSVEFRRAGAIRYDLFNHKFGKEKAVDVKLACDVISLTDIYDIAIIVSGDQDYVPAVQIAKDKGRHVVNVSFLARNGNILPGGARRLNQVTDWSYQVPYETLKSYLNISSGPSLPL
ncbi:MAG TPA: NYN domain-containing protein [Nitrospirota bacterium]